MNNHPASPARWNVISVFAPFVGFLCGLLVFSLHDYWGRGLDAGIKTLFGFFALGLLSALIAIYRVERLWPVTVLGVVINAIPFLFLLGMI